MSTHTGWENSGRYIGIDREQKRQARHATHMVAEHMALQVREGTGRERRGQRGKDAVEMHAGIKPCCQNLVHF